MSLVKKLLRKNIQEMKAYSSARSEFSGEKAVFLDANENSIGSSLPGPYERYPDPEQRVLKQKLALLKGVTRDQIFLGNGSDEAIDLLMRAFCNPGVDQILVMPPTYGMYEVCANLNDVDIVRAPLNLEYELNSELVLRTAGPTTKLIFICSPNNPTGNALDRQQMLKVITDFPGIVVLDEAYIDFAPELSLLPELERYPNLVILQTFSKAWGLAGLRLGMAFAQREIIEVLTKIKPPYNVSSVTQDLALKALDKLKRKDEMREVLCRERDQLARLLKELSFVQTVYRSDSNFLLVRMEDPKYIYQSLLQAGIVVRDRSNVALCEGCLRITVGSPEENRILMTELRRLGGWLEKSVVSGS